MPGGQENLIPFSSVEQAREMGSKGGKKSQEVQKKKKLTKEIYRALLETELNPNNIRLKGIERIKETLPQLVSNKMTVDEILVLVETAKAMAGDQRAIENIRNRDSGLPKQSVEMSGGTVNEIKVTFSNGADSKQPL